jgi:hypothetical protein
MLSFHIFASIMGVEAWSRTKKFADGIRYRSRESASKRISALEPKGTKALGGSGFWINCAAGLGEATGDTAGEAAGDAAGDDASAGLAAGDGAAWLGAAAGVGAAWLAGGMAVGADGAAVHAAARVATPPSARLARNERRLMEAWRNCLGVSCI